ncbi:MAG: hypothetical protein H6707_19220 [Deltaproteobacteria bacterium]|nr:hypothetical protein [Deltaproteobacteria bacterium]
MSQGALGGPFRGLLPYGSGDARLFFGRRPDQDKLRQLIAEAHTDPVLLCGEAAVGKTSLLLAGVLPALQDQRLVVYLDCTTIWPHQLRRIARQLLHRELALDEDAALAIVREAQRRQQPLLVVIDHVEHLVFHGEAEVATMRATLAAMRQSAAPTLVAVVDDGFQHELARLLGGGAARATVARLGRFNHKQATRVIEQTVLAGNGFMQADLPAVLADDLCARGSTLPAELQMVGHSLHLQRGRSVLDYQRMGAVRLLLEGYVDTITERCGGDRARRLLLEFAEQRDPRGALEPDSLSRTVGLPFADVPALLSQLDSHQVLRVADDYASRPGAKDAVAYRLVHPFLRVPVQQGCAAIRRSRRQASLSLRSAIHRRRPLTPVELSAVRKALGTALTPEEDGLVRRSRRLWRLGLIACGSLAVATLIVGLLMIRLSQHVDRAPGVPGVERVVVRSGRPGLHGNATTLVGGGRLRVDSGLSLSSLPARLEQQIRNRALMTTRSADSLLRQLFRALPGLRGAAWTALIGDESGIRTLERSLADEKTRLQAAQLLVALAPDRPVSHIALRRCLKDPRLAVRRYAVEQARRLGKAALPILAEAVAADKDAGIRRLALVALFDIDTRYALTVVPLGEREASVQRAIEAKLARAAKILPTEVYQLLAGGRTIDPGLTRRLSELRAELVASHSKALANILLPSVRGAADLPLLERVLSLENGVERDALRQLAGRFSSSQDRRMQIAALRLRARLGDNDEAFNQAIVELSKQQGQGPLAIAARQTAALALSESRGIPSKDRIDSLERLARDRSAEVRDAAISALLSNGNAGLRKTIVRIKERLDNGRSALVALCERDVRLSGYGTMAVFSAIWQTNSLKLRKQALRCAPTIARRHHRVGVWLSDRATSESNPELRLLGAGAAAAVALSVNGYLRLLRGYLRDERGDVRLALLDELLRRLPRSATKGAERPAAASAVFSIVARLVDDNDARVRRRVARLIEITGEDAKQTARQLGRLLRDKRTPVIAAALDALVDVGKKFGRNASEPSVSEALKALIVERPTLAARALEAAASIGLRKPLHAAVAHSSAKIRAAALRPLLRSMGRGSESAALGIIRSALIDDEQRVRIAAVEALAEAVTPSAAQRIALLTALVERDNGLVADRAIIALGNFTGHAKAAVDALSAGVRAPSERRRALSYQALGRLTAAEPRAVSLLIAGCADVAYDARMIAQLGLARHLARVGQRDVLVQQLLSADRNALVRRVMMLALSLQQRSQVRTPSSSANPSIVALAALRLADGLAVIEHPNQVAAWLYGW